MATVAGGCCLGWAAAATTGRCMQAGCADCRQPARHYLATAPPNAQRPPIRRDRILGSGRGALYIALMAASTVSTMVFSLTAAGTLGGQADWGRSARYQEAPPELTPTSNLTSAMTAAP